MTIDVVVRANIDGVVIARRTPGKIEGCLGFAIERDVEGDAVKSVVLDTQLPFMGQAAAPAGTTKPSTTWPIQRFVWTDYEAPETTAVRYRIRPVGGSPETTEPFADEACSAWSDPVIRRATESSPGYALYPNRGVVAAPWIEKRVKVLQHAAGKPRPSGWSIVQREIADPNSSLRADLAGPVLAALRDEFARAERDGESIHLALFELRDRELIDLIKAAGPRAHVILANGSFDTDDPDPNSQAADELTADGIDLRRRMVSSGHYAHNKFAVFSKGDGPERVWTGSTNWTPTGLCTQSNHAVLVSDATLARSYRDYWERLAESGSGYPPKLADDDTTATSPGQSDTRAWFAPVKHYVDLDDAGALIDGAQQGALFLMFRPGNDHTLVDNLERLHTRGLFIRGVVNRGFLGQDNTAPAIDFFNASATAQHVDPDLVLPDRLSETVGTLDPEVGVQGVLIHSKVVVIDPFGNDPVIITGSHNFGQKASAHNDDNLLIIRGQKNLAAEFAVYIMNVYDHYKWRYSLGLRRKHDDKPPVAAIAKSATHHNWYGLIPGDRWQTPHYLARAALQASFWFGASPVPPALPASPSR